MFLTEMNEKMRKVQFQNKTNISRAREPGVAENEIKKEKKTISAYPGF